MEITIYDKQVSQVDPVPIGMLWIRIPDLVEALRKQKVEQESGQGGWVTADAAGAMGSSGEGPAYGSYGHGAGGGSADFTNNNSLNFAGPMPGGMNIGPQQDGIDAWFSVEPAGAISLRLNFSELLGIFVLRGINN